MLRNFFTKKRIYILIFLWLLVNAAFNFGPWSISALKAISGGVGIPDLMLSYDLEKLSSMFAAFGAEGMEIYRKIQILDYIYPLIYGALLLGLLARLKIPTNFRSIYAFPFVTVFMDYSENIIFGVLMNHYPNFTAHDEHLANLAALCTNLKWSFLSLVILNIIGFWIWNLIKKRN